MKAFCHSTFTMTCLIGGVLLGTPSAQAQCPAGLTNPLNLINGTTWTFQTITDDVGSGVVGTFTASVQGPTAINPYTNGVLSITQTVNNGGNLTVKEQLLGRYSINSNCTGGELFINSNGNAVQYAFTFFSGATQMYMVANNTGVPNRSEGPFVGIHGLASIKTSFGCPAGLADPLFFINNGTWSFEAYDFLGAAVGTFTASVQAPTAKNPFLTGVLAGSESGTTAFGNVFTDQQISGKYQIDADCGGGVLYFNANNNAYQYYFVVANNPTRLLMVSNTPIGPNANTSGGAFRGNRGVARPF